MERDEHKLVVETLTKLESERKAFRLVGGVLVERTVGEVLPIVSQNFDGVLQFHVFNIFYYCIYHCVDKRIAIKVGRDHKNKGC